MFRLSSVTRTSVFLQTHLRSYSSAVLSAPSHPHSHSHTRSRTGSSHSLANLTRTDTAVMGFPSSSPKSERASSGRRSSFALAVDTQTDRERDRDRDRERDQRQGFSTPQPTPKRARERAPSESEVSLGLPHNRTCCAAVLCLVLKLDGVARNACVLVSVRSLAVVSSASVRTAFLFLPSPRAVLGGGRVIV